MRGGEITGMPEGFTPVVPFDVCFDAVYGLEVLSGDVDGEGVARAQVEVGERHLTPDGLVHGGVFASAAEALASRGTALTVIPDGFAAMGQGNDTTVLEPVSDGVISFEARVLSRSADAWLWTVDATLADGTVVAHSRVTVAVRAFQV
jgi:1,4-dihydroxy-2-naphthoyl-CoA hydrolase